MKLNNKVFRIIKILIIGYCGIGIILFYLQEKFLFHPARLPADHIFSFPYKFEEVNIAMNNTDTINMIRFLPSSDSAAGVVIYYHGNKINVTHYAEYAKIFTDRGYEVWMPDYPGFGKSTGERTEAKLYAQAMQVQKMAAAKFQDDIIVYGKSFGTGLAAYVAANSICKRLILETPYYSIPDLFYSFSYIYPSAYMSVYKLPVWKFLKQVKAPVTIFHGTDDNITFYSRALKLKPFLKAGDEFITIKNGGHNNLSARTEYRGHLNYLLANTQSQKKN